MYSSLTIGRKDSSTEGFIYLLYEFEDTINKKTGGRIARFNLSWLLDGKEITKYLN